MPAVTQLPESLEDFAYRNAVELDAGQNFDVGMTRLVSALDRIVGLVGGTGPRAFGANDSSRAVPPRNRSLPVTSASIAIALVLGLGGLYYGFSSQKLPSPASPGTVTTTANSPAASPPPPARSVPPPPPMPAPSDPEIVFWQSIERSNTIADFEEYLRKYPDGRFAGLAHNRLAALRPPTPPPLGTPQPGESFQDCRDCPKMVWIPPGQFMMGTEETERGSSSGERPRHLVVVKSPYAVSKFHVTRAEFAKFVAATRRVINSGCPWFSQTDHDPAVCVSWDDAKAFADWLSHTTGKNYGLLTEAGWEYAARAATTTARYWGNDLGQNNANCSTCGTRWDSKGTSPAGSFAPNAFGLYDMLGNAWQWVEDCWHDNYTDAPNDVATPWVGGNCSRRVARGGCWGGNNPLMTVRVGMRQGLVTGDRNFNCVGFRVARTQ